MAITIDSNSPQNSGNQSAVASASFNLTITNGLANPVLYVGVSQSGGTTISVSTVTYNGVGLTLITSCTNTSGIRTYIYRLINPTADGAAHSVTVTFSSAPTQWCAGAIAFGGVNQSTPEDGSASNQTSSGTTLTAAITTTVANDFYFVVGADASGFTTLAVGDSATSQWSVQTTGSVGGTKSLGAAGNITPTITLGQGGGIIGMSATALQPAASLTVAQETPMWYPDDGITQATGFSGLTADEWPAVPPYIPGPPSVGSGDYAYGSLYERQIVVSEADNPTIGTHASPTVRWGEYSYSLSGDQRISFSQSELFLPPAQKFFDEVDWQNWHDTRYQDETQEEDTGLLAIIPTWENWDEADVQQHNVDSRQQQDDEPWYTTFFIPTLAWDEIDWQHWSDTHWSAEEEDTGLLPIIPVWQQYDEPDAQQRNVDVRNQQDDEPWYATFFIPTLAWDEIDWQQWRGVFSQQDDEPWHTFFSIPAQAEWDEADHSERWTDAHWTAQEEDVGLQPIIPTVAWDEEQQRSTDSRVVTDADEFIFAPTNYPPVFDPRQMDWGEYAEMSSKSYWNLYAPETQEEDFGLIPALPALVIDEFHFYTGDEHEEN